MGCGATCAVSTVSLPPRRCSCPHANRVRRARDRFVAVDDESLRRFYTTLLKPEFPAAELITYEELRDARLKATMRGAILFDVDNPVTGIVTEDHLEGRVLPWFTSSWRRRPVTAGSGRDCSTGPRRAPVPLVLVKIEDPRCFAVSDAGNPIARVCFYDRVGSHLLPLPYVQPSLRPGSPRVDGMLLIAIGVPGPDVDGSLVAAFLDEYYGLCEGEEVVRTDPTYLALHAAALGDEQGRLPLLSLSALEAARPHPAGTSYTADAIGDVPENPTVHMKSHPGHPGQGSVLNS